MSERSSWSAAAPDVEVAREGHDVHFGVRSADAGVAGACCLCVVFVKAASEGLREAYLWWAAC